MRTLEELQDALQANPNSFETLYEYICALAQTQQNYPYLFALTERAIAVYEISPVPEQLSRCQEVQRLHAQLLRDHLDKVLGDLWPITDPRWTPVFKLGRPREIAFSLGKRNLHELEKTLRSENLKRMRFLSATITDATDEVLALLRNMRLQPLRVLNFCFMEDVSETALASFFKDTKDTLRDLCALSIRAPHITDGGAIAARRNIPGVESFSVVSMDRTTMTTQFAEFIADDKNSNRLMNLCIIGSDIGDRGLLAMLTSGNLRNLQTLDLHDGSLTNASARLIAADDLPPHLRSIDLRFNQIDPAGIHFLKNIKNLKIASDSQHARPKGRI